MLVGMMADAAAAAHEHHGNIGNVGHRHAVMARPRDGSGDCSVSSLKTGGAYATREAAARRPYRLRG
jgi:hypothetical protein